MKVGRLITDERIEFSFENSQIKGFIEYLRRQEAGESLAAELSILEYCAARRPKSLSPQS